MTKALPFTAFVAPARRRPELWRLVLGLLVVVLVMVVWVALGIGLLALAVGLSGAMEVMATLADPVTPRATLILLSTFVGMFLAPIVAARLLHRRGARSLFGPGRVVLRDFFAALAISAVIYGAMLFFWFAGFDAVANVPPALWLALLPLSLLAVAVQTGAEELLFRGYIMQQLAARFPTPLVYMLVPSLLFGLLHYDPNTLGSNAWAVVGSTAFFGLIAADLTNATGSVGAAWGLHMANNVVAILLLSTQGTITGLALFVTPYAASEVAITGPLLMADLALIIVVWIALRWRLGR
ncbi:type II CAAX endopeptidase family protein [Palleronia sp. LCG004]|uniref:CPBP family intramembrane glutamic endopeptidase n=1 Tax=Palleronia sp. LCG004 TaxID=3079304 RepID=UPI0029438FF3|nr:type II CAAX endopeptidase family protein [Palleronia sp. LCG004]WOI56049.1 type II CAAX endopeptidase family protein [Palleronia sp. LCG004]